MIVSVYPQSTKQFLRTNLDVTVRYRSNWTLKEFSGFEERGKPEHPEKNLSKQRRQPTTNSTHIYVVDAWIRTRATLEGSVPNSAPTSLPIPISTLAPSYWHRGNHFGFQEWGYYSFRPPPHPLRMFFTAFFISRILQQYTTGFIKELTKITVPEKS